MLEVERWAEIRRMSRVEGLSQREISKQTGLHRRHDQQGAFVKRPAKLRTARRNRPQSSTPTAMRSKLCSVSNPTLSGVRILEEIRVLGYTGGKSILNELLQELRPRHQPPPRTYQRTTYRPG